MKNRVEVKRITPEDLKILVIKKGESYVGTDLSEAQIKALADTPFAYSIYVDEELTMCAGVTEYWKNRGEAWAILDPSCGKKFVVLHNVVKRFLDVCPVKRIEATVDVNFERGHRWVKALGFQLEADCLKSFFPDGKDASLYSRINSGGEPWL